jgi:hypothetical protein
MLQYNKQQTTKQTKNTKAYTYFSLKTYQKEHFSSKEK